MAVSSGRFGNVGLNPWRRRLTSALLRTLDACARVLVLLPAGLGLRGVGGVIDQVGLHVQQLRVRHHLGEWLSAPGMLGLGEICAPLGLGLAHRRDLAPLGAFGVAFLARPTEVVASLGFTALQ